jgi:hypothetical protein
MSGDHQFDKTSKGVPLLHPLKVFHKLEGFHATVSIILPIFFLRI